MNRRNFIQNSFMAGLAVSIFPFAKRKPKNHKVKIADKTIQANAIKGIQLIGDRDPELHFIIPYTFDKPIKLNPGDTITITYKAIIF